MQRPAGELANDAHFNPANPNNITFFNGGRIAYLNFVDKGAISAIQIFEHPGIALKLKPGVL